MSLLRLDSARAWALAVAVASVALYSPTLGHGFVYDDNFVVVQNRFIRSLDQLPNLVRSTEWAGSGFPGRDYRPLTDVTYALNHAATGLSPWSYHATNVVLHALAAVLLLAVGLRLGLAPTAAGAAALLFAIHPIHVEAVANVVGRKDVLATVFSLAAVLLHRRALRRGGASLAWPVLTSAAAMLSKESGVVALGLVALHDLAAPPPGGGPVPLRRRAALYVAYALALGSYLLLRRAIIAGPFVPVTVGDNPTAYASAAVRVMTAVAVIGKGLALQLIPMGQSPDWSYQAIPLVTSPADPRFLAAAAALASWLGLGLALRRRAPVVLVGLAWYLGALLPASNLLFPSFTIFGERLLYLPSAGLVLVAGAGLSALAARIPRAPLAVGSLGAGLALGAATLSYSHAWADELPLFRLAVERVPRSSHAHEKLSCMLVGSGETAAALAEAERAIALDPGNAAAHLCEAQALHKLGRPEEEARALRAALAAAAGDADVRLGRFDEKARRSAAASDASPGNADALYGLARLARDEGRLEDAADLWRRAIASNPRHAASLADLAGYHLLRGETDVALSLSLRAVDADPKLASAWYNLGLLHQVRGDTARSRSDFARFVETAGPEYAREVEAVRQTLGAAGGR